MKYMLLIAEDERRFETMSEEETGRLMADYGAFHEKVDKAGVFLGAIQLRTGSLWVASGVHLGWNWALGYAADLPVSGLELADSPLYEGVPRGAEWISGGAFGPEGSVLATAGFALAAYLVWRSPRFKPGQSAKDVRPLILSAPGHGPDWEGAEGDSELEDSGSEG